MIFLICVIMLVLCIVVYTFLAIGLIRRAQTAEKRSGLTRTLLEKECSDHLKTLQSLIECQNELRLTLERLSETQTQYVEIYALLKIEREHAIKNAGKEW